MSSVVGDYSFAGVPLLLLHHRGRRSGAERVNPLQYRVRRDGHIVFATNGGSPTHPHWYLNVHALRHALVPLVSLSAWVFGALLTGAVVVETMFSRPGLGRVMATLPTWPHPPRVFLSDRAPSLSAVPGCNAGGRGDHRGWVWCGRPASPLVRKAIRQAVSLGALA
ncbi:nitroreductase/quinone reductase family protein [Frankia sp. AvcI1]|uniref:nitroreductase/quinone reductase family protein n=1 Tax=Frankia sp. AvcI1 TaxID=573496 RepID=UPI002117FC8A|nr:nitroreductase/quinone reductase family protein [Frankia sp. AvcI1]